MIKGKSIVCGGGDGDGGDEGKDRDRRQSGDEGNMHDVRWD